ncbi:MAG: tetratricopeptide repeat protein [Chitinispirillales bacterium]|jgi:TolA-binding protein|nr:tetratricopeptide repeat protein [Chitinispirillales bacterium]
MKPSFVIAPVGRVVFTCAAMVLLLASSGSARRRGSAESEAILPQIDVIRVKESADEALRTANDLRREVAALSAQLTALDNRLILLSEEVSRVSSAKIEELEVRLALLTEAYKDMHVRLHALDLIVRPAPAPVVQPGRPPTFAATSEGLIVASPEYDLYQTGLRLFNARSFERALAAFTECVSKFPDGEFRDRVRFWMGECHYQMANMELAIEEYRKVLAFPNSSKADAAQFQIALAHQKLGQTERARAEFRRLIERFPGSSFTERARRYLADLR